MKITAIGHASILIEADGIKILSDPWWRGPCFGAQWWNYPAPFLEALEGIEVDYIYISHGHHDHLHPGTLKTLNRTAKVLVSKNLDIADPIQKLGFEVISLGDEEEYALSERVKCRIMETYSSDTLMCINDGKETCINLNDALHSAPEPVQARFIGLLKGFYPEIDYVFCGYGVASHFPNCYVIPGKDRDRTAARRQAYFNRQWARLIHGLAPRFGFPFAADVAFFEDDLFWVNEPTANSERPTEAFKQMYPASSTQVLDIAPGFTVENGGVKALRLRSKTSEQIMKETCKDSIERANRHGRVEHSAIEEIHALLEQNVALCRDYLSTYPGNYRFLIRFHNSSEGIEVSKAGKNISLAIIQEGAHLKTSYDVIYTTRLPYLKWSLTIPYGHEILFVGSGGIFEYLQKDKIKYNMHRELIMLMKKRETCPAPRYGKSSKIMFRLKQTLKKLLGRTDPDLYDLESWTVFNK